MQTMTLRAILLAVMCLASVSARLQPFIERASYKDQEKVIEIAVSYSGGCATHRFRLEIGDCLEIFPAICRDAKLFDLTTTDGCKANIRETIKINLSEAGLNTDYYTGAIITINGSGESIATITLPGELRMDG